MTRLDLYDFKLEYTFADQWQEELDRQLALLLSTVEGSMPLDREFGVNMDYIDKPIEVAKSLYAAEVTKKILKFIDKVRVKEITWQWTENGTLRPKVAITSA